MPNMGTFRVDFEIENPVRPGERRSVRGALVDTGAELSWVPSDVLESLGIERYSKLRFRQASGAVLERWTGAAFVHVAEKRTKTNCLWTLVQYPRQPRRSPYPTIRGGGDQ